MSVNNTVATRRNEHLLKAARFLTLIVFSIGCIFVIVFTSGAFRNLPAPQSDEEKGGGGAAVVVNPNVRLPVSIVSIAPEPLEILDGYTGMIRPYERYNIGFEIGGRVNTLGKDEAGEPLDVGDPLQKDQVIARLDDRIATSQLKEAKANLEKNQSDKLRADELRNGKVRAITESEYQNVITQLTLAETRFEIAEKNLTDSVLKSPVDGVISKRLTHAGESVAPHQQIFEILDLNRVLLVVGVPESRVREIQEGKDAHVDFLGLNRYGKKWPGTRGIVYRVGQASDDQTGLFEVEIVIENKNGDLKPGLVATARIVLDRIEGFKIPINAAIFRHNRPTLFSVRGSGDKQTVHRFEPKDWTEQDSFLILRDLPAEDRTIVYRGQHRLVEGSFVRVFNVGTESEKEEISGEVRVLPSGGKVSP